MIMVTVRSTAWVLLFFIISSSSLSSPVHAATDSSPSSSTTADCRGRQCESIEVPRREVDLESTYPRRPGSRVFCQPDANGYFGSTFGQDYLELKYSFGLEVLHSADMTQIFQAFSTAIEDLLIGTYFAEVCTNPTRQNDNNNDNNNGSNSWINRRLTGKGFRFVPVLSDAEYESCTSEVLDSAHCGVYEGLVEAYGESNSGVLDTILNYLNDGNEIHPMILRSFAGPAKTLTPTATPITTAPTQEPPEQRPVNPETGETAEVERPTPTLVLPPTEAPTNDNDGSNAVSGSETTTSSKKRSAVVPAILGILASFLLLVAGVGGFLYFDRRRKRNANNSTKDVRASDRSEPLNSPVESKHFLDEFEEVDLASLHEEEYQSYASNNKSHYNDDDANSMRLVV